MTAAPAREAVGRPVDRIDGPAKITGSARYSAEIRLPGTVAQFAEVAVDADLGTVRVRRMAAVMAPGRVLNAKTARSQVMGGMLWGRGQALLEATSTDPRDGRWAGASLGEYLVPVNADPPDVDIEFVQVEDGVVNPLGVKGLGEVGMVGAAAAVANAVFHATGVRVRELPIRVEHLL